MRTSCNGCRVLRKGCSEDCTIRPCLQWIKSPESQANATVFLAKFYGRAGLLNLLNAGPEHLRPAVLKSLLYEACGRVVDPVNGSVGLMWSGQWHCCQIAVDAVLKGLPIMRMPQQSQVRYDNRDRQIPSSDPSSSAADPRPVVEPKLPQDDIRHVSSSCSPTGAADSPAGFFPARVGHRTGNHSSANYGGGFYSYMQGKTVGGRNWRGEETGGREDSQEDRESMFSVETVEPAMTDIEQMGELGVVGGRSQSGESDDRIGLELTLGFNHDQGFPGSSSTMTNGYRGRRREY